MIHTNIQRIKQIVLESTNDNLSKLILFGSRARKDFREDSDYDFLVILKQTLSRKELLEIYKSLKQKCAREFIPNDFIIRTEEEIAFLSHIPGTSTTYNALLEGNIV